MVRRLSRDNRDANTYIVQTSKIGKMQLLIFFNSFEREKGENTLSLGVLVDDNVLHPTVRRTAVILCTRRVST